MKTRFFRFASALFAGAALLATGCATDYGDDIRALNKRIDELGSVKVASLESQVLGLLSTVSTLETAAKHDEDIQKLGKDITDLETALKSDYEKKIKDAVDALNTALDNKLDKTTFDSAKDLIESGMQGLSDRIKAIEDADFQKQISDLNDALGKRLGKLEDLLAGDWDGKTVKQAIDAVKQSVVDLDTAINGELGLLKQRMDDAEAAIKKINEEIIPGINKDIADLRDGKVDKADYDAYKEATGKTIGLMQSAINSLTALTAGFPEGKTIKEYIDGILVNFDDYVLKTTFDEFVKIAATKEELNSINSQLDGRLNALEALLAGEWGGVTVKKYIEDQVSALQGQLDAITNAEGSGRLDLLEKAEIDLDKLVRETILPQIKFALDYTGTSGKGLQGYIDDGDAAALKAAKEYTDGQILLVKSMIEQITNAEGTGRLDRLENSVTELVGRIQSIVFVPAFEDGKMTVTASGSGVNTFKIMPADAANDVVALFASNPDAFSFDVETVTTRSGNEAALKLSVTDVQLNTANAGKGWVDVSVGSNFKGLSDEDKAIIYSAALVINDKDSGTAISSLFYTIFIDAGTPIAVHEYVDLDLPSGLKWATCNIGANSREENGDYFAWGETETKDTYLWNTYNWMQKDKDTYHYITKYTFADGQTEGIWYNGDTFVGDDEDGDGIGDGNEHKDYASYDYADDPARKIWGGTWRTPSPEDFEELMNNTTVTWTEDSGVMGRLFTASNGETLFLPAAGYRNSKLLDDGSWGNYWSSSLRKNNSASTTILRFSSSLYIMGSYLRYTGLPVRPVCSQD